LCVKKGKQLPADIPLKRTKELDAALQASYVARLAMRVNPLQMESTGRSAL
jgi:hypothetical protein